MNGARSSLPKTASCCGSDGVGPPAGDLELLVSAVRACRLCVEAPKARALPHDPRPVLRVSGTAQLVVAGQAPGTRVHQSGVPFTDPSGDRLREWMGVTLEEFYDASRVAIVPMGFCFPGLDAKGGDLPPRPECAPHWRAKLFDAMPQVELVLAVGQYAHWWHLPGKRRPVTETVRHGSDALRDLDGAAARSPRAGRRRPASLDPAGGGGRLGRRLRVIALPHPSWRNNHWLKANPWFETDLLPALRAEVRRLLA